MTIEELHANDHTALEERRPSCFRVLVCYSSPCRAAGAEAVFESLVQTVNTLHLDFEVEINATGCTARCTDGPLVRVCIPGMKDVVYTNVTPECIIGILKENMPGLAVPE